MSSRLPTMTLDQKREDSPYKVVDVVDCSTSNTLPISCNLQPRCAIVCTKVAKLGGKVNYLDPPYLLFRYLLLIVKEDNMYDNRNNHRHGVVN